MIYITVFLLLIVAIKLLSQKGKGSVKEIMNYIKSGSIIIDVRSKGEFDSYHVNKAINIPYDSISKGIKKVKITKEKPILLYCASGTRATVALNTLKSLGYSNVLNCGSIGRISKLMK
jgi:phage shock protein E